MNKKKTAVVAALLIAFTLAGCATEHTAPQGPSSSSTSSPIKPDPEQPCPGTRPAIVSSAEIDGSNTRLVPFTPTGALVCQYGPAVGPSHNGRLIAARALDAAQAATLATRINVAVTPKPKVPLGSIGHCPGEEGKKADVFAWDRSKAIQVEIDMDGCEYADNGSLLHAYIGRSDLSTQIDKLAPVIDSPTPSPSR